MSDPVNSPDQYTRYVEGERGRFVVDSLVHKVLTEGKMTDSVNSPDHYTSGEIECIDALRSALSEAEFRGFCKGNALKYLWRAGRKGCGEEDIRKAIWYSRAAIGDDPREQAVESPMERCHDRSDGRYCDQFVGHSGDHGFTGVLSGDTHTWVNTGVEE